MDKDNYEEIYDSMIKYEELCFNIYKQIKDKGISNTFIKGVGTTLFKYKRVTPKQLRALIKTLKDAEYSDLI